MAYEEGAGHLAARDDDVVGGCEYRFDSGFTNDPNERRA